MKNHIDFETSIFVCFWMGFGGGLEAQNFNFRIFFDKNRSPKNMTSWTAPKSHQEDENKTKNCFQGPWVDLTIHQEVGFPPQAVVWGIRGKDKKRPKEVKLIILHALGPKARRIFHFHCVFFPYF